MKITIEEGGYYFSRDFKEEHPNIDEAVFAVYYLLSRIYSSEQVKIEIQNLLEDI